MSLSDLYKYKYSVRDPIHGSIPFTELEKRIMDTLHYQRLRNIVQNSMCYRVFPGARHTRFEHSLGVMHLAGRLFDSLNRADAPFVSFTSAYGLTEEQALQRRQIFRLGSMLHDIGHGPFSHAAEALPDAKHHEAWSLEFISSEPIKSILDEAGIDHQLVQLVAVEAKEEFAPMMDVTKLTPDILQLGQLLTGELGVDRMDYLLRDSYFCGVRYGMFEVERLIESMHLLEHNTAVELVLGADGVSAAEALTFARFQMFSSVYFHKTVTILNWHLSKFVESQLANNQYPQEIDRYVHYDDCEVHRAMSKVIEDGSGSGFEHAQALLQRKHNRLAWETTFEVFDRLKITKPKALIQAVLDQIGLKEDVDYVYLDADSKGQAYSTSKIKVYQNGTVHNFSTSARVASAIPRIKFARVYVPENSTRKLEVRAVLNTWEEDQIKAHE